MKLLFPMEFLFIQKKGALSSLLSLSKDNIENTTPSFQIILTATDSSENVKQNINKNHNKVSWDISTIRLNHDYFNSSNTYPNTVYAYYQKDGTLLNISLQNSNNISSLESSFIINCYKNGTDICNNQISYRLTPFFVT